MKFFHFVFISDTTKQKKYIYFCWLSINEDLCGCNRKMYHLDANQSSLKLEPRLWRLSLFWGDTRRAAGPTPPSAARGAHLILITSGSSGAHRECEIHFSHISAVATSEMWKQACSNPHVWWRYLTSVWPFYYELIWLSTRERKESKKFIFTAHPETFQKASKMLCNAHSWTDVDLEWPLEDTRPPVQCVSAYCITVCD